MKYTFSPTFQKKILSLIARENRFMLEYRNVFKVSYFDAEFKDLAKILLEIFDKNHAVVSKETFSEYVREKGLMDLDDDLIQEVYEKECPDAIVREMILDFAKRASIRDGILTAAEEIDKVEDVNQLSNKLYECLKVGTPSSPGINFFNSDVEKVLASQEYTGMIRYTGIKELDKHTNGMRVGDCFVVMGATGRGKSIFLVNMGVHNLIGDGDVYHFTIGDLSEEDVYSRYLTRMTRIPIDLIIKNPKNPDIKERILKYKDRFSPGNLIIKYLPPGSCTVGDVRSLSTSYRAKTGKAPKLIIIDYPDELICQRSRSNGNSYEDLGAIYSEIKSLGFEMDCPIAVASQVNRNGQNKASSEEDMDVESIMMQMSDSMKKCFKADTIVSLFQSKREREKDSDGYQTMRCFITKCRRGVDGKVVTLKVNKLTMRFLGQKVERENTYKE